MLIAKKSNISDYNRIGIFDTATKKTLKDRRARVLDVEAVASANEVLVKDLGELPFLLFHPSSSYRTCLAT